jgi:hypothetical protein
MSMGLDHLNSAMQPILMAQKQNVMLRNQVTQQAIERREQQFSQGQRVMASGFEAMNHTMTARGGMVDVSI